MVICEYSHAFESTRHATEAFQDGLGITGRPVSLMDVVVIFGKAESLGELTPCITNCITSTGPVQLGTEFRDHGDQPAVLDVEVTLVWLRDLELDRHRVIIRGKPSSRSELFVTILESRSLKTSGSWWARRCESMIVAQGQQYRIQESIGVLAWQIDFRDLLAFKRITSS